MCLSSFIAPSQLHDKAAIQGVCLLCMYINAANLWVVGPSSIGSVFHYFVVAFCQALASTCNHTSKVSSLQARVNCQHGHQADRFVACEHQPKSSPCHGSVMTAAKWLNLLFSWERKSKSLDRGQTYIIILQLMSLSMCCYFHALPSAARPAINQ